MTVQRRLVAAAADAMMKKVKLDIAALQAAYEGTAG